MKCDTMKVKKKKKKKIGKNALEGFNIQLASM